MTKNKEEFLKILSDDTYGLCPAPTSSALAIQVLTDYLLGEDFYVVMPMPQEQVNTEIVATILEKYSKEYRRDIKQIKSKE